MHIDGGQVTVKFNSKEKRTDSHQRIDQSTKVRKGSDNL